ncbi:unnamed protein product [Adineta ricciae]|uniref:Uncharacterized protein n=1 Tax=Adineta ricciae TaxID=249248 RepID=A0A813WU52_ADIRI|nr:unnamed protein product [Adineta ricciae]CAF0866141.1 unnamed protein product [Adineta ricciae]
MTKHLSKSVGPSSPYLLIAVRWVNIRVLSSIGCFIILLFILRYNFITCFYIIQTYLTWFRFYSGVITANDNFDTSMSSYPPNQTSAQPTYADIVPAILHHIVIGNLDLAQRPTWVAARDACLKWHPNYEYRFWNDSSAEHFIRKEYPWFLQTWETYPYPVQRADSLRYLVLYRYGGIFLDMDLHCRRSLGPLRRFEFISPLADPVGISNGFLMVSARHPFFKVLVEQLPLFNRNFILPYATVMFSTGCMYLSTQYSLFSERCRLKLLNYEQHRLSGNISTPLFHHQGSSSWHSSDAAFIKNIYNVLRHLIYHRNFLLINLFSIIIVVLVISYRRRVKSQERHRNVLQF